MKFVAGLALAATLGTSAYAEVDQDLLVFGSVNGLKRYSDSDSTADGFNSGVMADFLYTLNTDRVGLLAEYVWSDTENELERLHLSAALADRTTVWFGRFHSIANYWVSEFHHGQYLQTSISRPGIEEWEDDSGPLPSHITGAAIEHRIPVHAESEISVAFAAGLAPKLVESELVPFDFLDAEGGHKLSLNGKIVFTPDIVGENRFGLLLASNEIDVDSDSSPALAEIRNVDQRSVGVFSDWRWQSWRWILSLTYVDSELEYTDEVRSDEFMAGYVQGEYSASDKWTFFGRHEFASGEDDSIYLTLLPEFVAHRNMIGVRWDFHKRQSLTAEVAEVQPQAADFTHGDFNEVRVQWSAALP